MSSNETQRRECDRNCEEHNSICQKLHELHMTICGNGDIKKGIAWKVEQNTEFISAVKKIFWPGFTVAMVGAISASINFFQKVFMHIYKIGG